MKNANAHLFRIATLVAVLSVYCIAATAQTQGAMKQIGVFNGTNGSSPVSDLIQLPNGNFLGVTLPPERYPNTAGTIYQLSAGGKIQVLYRLAADGSQGAVFNNIYNPVTQASDGKIYGVMYQTSSTEGIAYRFTLPSGPFEVLHTFNLSDKANGNGPNGKLVQALDGNLYGVCQFGGDTVDGNPDGLGTIFRIGLDGSFSSVYSFSPSTVAGYQISGLTLHPNGKLYGVRLQGPLFEFDTALGSARAVVNVAAYPASQAPALGTDGNLYVLGQLTNTCAPCVPQILQCGIDGSGPVVEFTFPPSSSLGVNGSLIQISDGSFIGGYYGTNGNQEVFQVNTVAQTLTTYTVPQQYEKQFLGNLTQGVSGGVVGALYQIHANPALGALYGLYLSLPKPLPSVLGFYPSTVPVGGTFAILGSSFVGAQSVSINGQNLAFTVKASGAISVTAPNSAITGPVIITSPAGSTTSAQTLTVQ